MAPRPPESAGRETARRWGVIRIASAIYPCPRAMYRWRVPAAANARIGAMRTVTEPGMGTLEVFPLDTSEKALFALLEDVFANYWRNIVFGSMVQGAVFEIRAPNAPRRISVLDGYLTVDFGAWHFHVCIGAHKGSAAHPVDRALAAHRRTARAELYRCLDDDGAPTSWGLRLLNGKDEQQMTVFLPNPFLSEDQKVLKTPEWSRLALWDHLRKTTLDLDPDPKDRTATAFAH